jgi:hypothetical protein
VQPVLSSWWRAAEAVARLIAWPRTDVASIDAATAEVFGRSTLLTAASAVIAMLERGWRSSRTRVLALRLRDAVPAGVASRRRFAATVVMVAALTVLALQSVKPGPREPLAWFLPAMIIIAAALVMAAEALRRGDPRDDRQ